MYKLWRDKLNREEFKIIYFINTFAQVEPFFSTHKLSLFCTPINNSENLSAINDNWSFLLTGVINISSPLISFISLQESDWCSLNWYESGTKWPSSVLLYSPIINYYCQIHTLDYNACVCMCADLDKWLCDYLGVSVIAIAIRHR